MRRLPVYFVVDVSESMVGEPIEQVQNGMRNRKRLMLPQIMLVGRREEQTSLMNLHHLLKARQTVQGINLTK